MHEVGGVISKREKPTIYQHASKLYKLPAHFFHSFRLHDVKSDRLDGCFERPSGYCEEVKERGGREKERPRQTEEWRT